MLLFRTWHLMCSTFHVGRLEASKDCDMKKKLLVLLIAVIPTLMPNLVFAVAIELPVGDICHWSWVHVWWVDC